MAIIDSYTEVNSSTVNQLNAGGNIYVSQSITGNGSTVGSAVFYLSKTGTPTGNLTAQIFAHTGTYGSTSQPTGSVLATSDVFNIATLTGTLQLITFTFSGVNQIALSNATNYCLLLNYSGGDTSNKLNFGEDTTSPTHAGNIAFSTNGTTWNIQASIDLCFYLYDLAGVPIYIQFNNYQFVKVGNGMSVSEKIR